MNTAIVSGSGASSGVGFAIPAAMAKQVVATALGGGHAVATLPAAARRPPAKWPRASASPRRKAWWSPTSGPGGRGSAVSRGDVIVSVDGEPVNDEAALTYRVTTRRFGDLLTLEVRRNGGAARP